MTDEDFGLVWKCQNLLNALVQELGRAVGKIASRRSLADFCLRDEYELSWIDPERSSHLVRVKERVAAENAEAFNHIGRGIRRVSCKEK